MTRRRVAIVFIAVASLAGGMLYSRQMPVSSEPKPPPAVEIVGQHRPPFTLGAADGRQVSVSEFDGKILLINFWATWCTPCRAEMPMLVDFQKEYQDRGLSIVGIALDDVQQAREFAEELGVSYTVLVGGADVIATGMVYGNQAGMLPYSVLVGRDGIVRWAHLGELHEDALREQLELLF